MCLPGLVRVTNEDRRVPLMVVDVEDEEEEVEFRVEIQGRI